jgi:hypothetical protein
LSSGNRNFIGDFIGDFQLFSAPFGSRIPRINRNNPVRNSAQMANNGTPKNGRGALSS